MKSKILLPIIVSALTTLLISCGDNTNKSSLPVEDDKEPNTVTSVADDGGEDIKPERPVYNELSRLGFKIADKEFFPISMTIVDQDVANTTVEIGIAALNDEPIEKTPLVITIDGVEKKYSSLPKSPYRFEISKETLRAMLSAQTAIINFHVIGDKYYETDFTYDFKDSFRSQLANQLK